MRINNIGKLHLKIQFYKSFDKNILVFLIEMKFVKPISSMTEFSFKKKAFCCVTLSTELYNLHLGVCNTQDSV